MNSKRFFQSPNFIMAVIAAALALFANVTNSDISAVLAFIPALIALWNKVKDGNTLPLLEWLGKANVRSWIAQALIIAVPALTPDLLKSVWDLVDAAIGKNWNAVLIILLNVATAIYKIIRGSGTKSRYVTTMTVFLLLAVTAVDAQSKREVRSVEKRNARAISGGADIVLPPMEQVPEAVTKRDAMSMNQTNWGRDMLLPQSVRNRVYQECTHSVVVKVADTGPTFEHPDLQKGQLKGADYTGPATPRTKDANGHGTHCAGIIGARDLGLAWGLVDKGLLQIKAVGVLSDGGSGSFAWVANAINSELVEDRRLLGQGTGVVWSGSLSGQTSPLQQVEQALLAGTNAGVNYVFAAGNSGQPGVGYPGSSQYSLAVASLDQNLARSAFSSTGPQVWAAMPGRSINSTFRGNTYAVLSGTSMATPFLTAALCIAKSKYGPQYLTNLQQTRAYLAWVCTDIAPNGKDNNTGYGVAFILSILDKHPKDTPALPVLPPNPPNPVDPPNPPQPPVDAFPERTISVTIPGPYTFSYFAVMPNSEAAAYATAELSAAGATVSNMRSFTVTEVVLEVKTKAEADQLYGASLANAKWFYEGRGFGLPSPTDAVEAASWSTYFLELLFKTQVPIKQAVVVQSLKGKSDRGAVLEFDRSKLRHIPQ